MRRRLVLLATAISTMVALAFLVPLALLVRTLAEYRAMNEARQLAQMMAPTIATGDERGIVLALQTASVISEDRVTVFMPDGRILGASVRRDAHVELAMQGEAFTAVLPEGHALFTPLFGPGDTTAVVRVLIPEEIRMAGVATSWAVLSGLSVALVLGAVLLADRLATSVVLPAREAAAAARALAAGEQRARAPVAGPPEVADIAAALNTLADRIDARHVDGTLVALLLAEREAAADISHRLRIPMTALSLDVEELGDSPAAAQLTADLEALEREVDRVIRDARRPSADLRCLCEASALVRSRAEFWSVLAEDEDRPLAVELPSQPVFVAVEEQELQAVLDTLVSNVLAHTPARTSFRMGLRVDGDLAVIVVEDDGPGWPAGDVVARGMSSRDSTGLGLDIARRTAERHGGRLRLGSSANGGARVEIALPAAS
jgi:signal transduction histidine kinase